VPTSLPSPRPRVGLFVTCLVDLIRPSIGFAAVKLLEDSGCNVEVPSQTCCGQPAFNSGDRATARAMASRIIADFSGFDYVVAPSGSCAGMIKVHLPELFADDPNLVGEARALADKTHELVSFLVDVMKVERVKARFSGTVTYHDSCSGLRELDIREQPRKLLSSVEGLSLQELADADICCGFGGTFAVKYPDVSAAMLADKMRAVIETGAEVLCAGDRSCLMHIGGGLERIRAGVRTMHLAEILAST